MIVGDLVQLLYRVPGARRIFFHRDLRRLGSALNALAGLHRRHVIGDTRLVAVAGSLGKTTTRRALHAALACPERGFAYSNYGVRLATNVLRVRRGDPYAVIEAGIGAPGYMAGYARMLQPDIAVMTSIRSEHSRSFPTLDDTRNEKVKMISALGPAGVAILNGDDSRVRWMATQTRARAITFGLDEGNDVRATELRDTPDGLAFDAILKTGTYPVRTRFLGTHMVYPFLAALAVAELEGIAMDGVLARLAELEPADSRMVVVRLPNGATILDDSFKNSIETIHAAFSAFSGMAARRRIVVLGGVESPPGRQGDTNRELGRRLGQFADRVYCLGGHDMTGIRTGAVASGMDAKAVQLLDDDHEAAASLLAAELRAGDAVLIKGRSTQRLRRIVLRLMGRPVTCSVRQCNVKVASCDVCPLLDASPDLFGNHFIARFIRA